MRYIKYFFSARNAYRIHSPFVYEMYTEVYEEHFRSNVDYELVYRVGRLLDRSRYFTRRKRKMARFLYRYAAYYEPKNVYLYGRVTAMVAAALALGNPHTRVSVPKSCRFVETLNAMGVVNVEVRRDDDFRGTYMENRGGEVLFAIQGPHENKEIESLWNAMLEDVDVTLTLDFYRVGMVFYKDGMEKQNIVIR